MPSHLDVERVCHVRGMPANAVVSVERSRTNSDLLYAPKNVVGVMGDLLTAFQPPRHLWILVFVVCSTVRILREVDVQAL